MSGYPLVFGADNTLIASPFEPYPDWSIYSAQYVWLGERLIGAQSYGNEEGVVVTALYVRGSLSGGFDFEPRPHDTPEIRLVETEGEFTKELVRAGETIYAFGYEDSVWQVDFTNGDNNLSYTQGVVQGASDIYPFVDSNARPEVQGATFYDTGTGLARVTTTSMDVLTYENDPAMFAAPVYNGLLITPRKAGE